MEKTNVINLARLPLVPLKTLRKIFVTHILEYVNDKEATFLIDGYSLSIEDLRVCQQYYYDNYATNSEKQYYSMISNLNVIHGQATTSTLRKYVVRLINESSYKKFSYELLIKSLDCKLPVFIRYVEGFFEHKAREVMEEDSKISAKYGMRNTLDEQIQIYKQVFQIYLKVPKEERVYPIKKELVWEYVEKYLHFYASQDEKNKYLRKWETLSGNTLLRLRIMELNNFTKLEYPIKRSQAKIIIERYLENYATKEERAQYEAALKQKMLFNSHGNVVENPDSLEPSPYTRIFDKLIEIDDVDKAFKYLIQIEEDQLYTYLMDNIEIYELSKLFKCKKESGKALEEICDKIGYLKLVLEMFAEYLEHKKKQTQNKKDDETEQRKERRYQSGLKVAIKYATELVQKGITSYSELPEELKCALGTYENKIVLVRNNAPEIYKQFSDLKEEKRRQAFKIIENEFHLIMNGLENGVIEFGYERDFNTIDYYTITSMPYNLFCCLVMPECNQRQQELLKRLFRVKFFQWDILWAEEAATDTSFTIDEQTYIITKLEKAEIIATLKAAGILLRKTYEDSIANLRRKKMEEARLKIL